MPRHAIGSMRPPAAHLKVLRARAILTEVDHAAIAAGFKELAHADRLRILDALDQGDKSATAIAERYGRNVPAVSYHVRALAEAGYVQLVGTRPVRGALARDYALTEHGRRALDRLAFW